MTDHKVAAFAALVALVLALALGLQMAGGAGAAEGEKSPPDSFQAVPGSTADAGAVFSALRAAPDDADRANGAMVALGREQPWLKVSGSRQVGSSALGPVWLSPTSDGRVCLTVETASGPAMTCDTLSRARTIGVVLEADGQFVGVVPDGTTEATLAFADGTAKRLEISGGVFDTPSRRSHLTVRSAKDVYGLDLQAFTNARG